MKWNVFEHDFNAKEIKIYNIFDHGRFAEDVKKTLKKTEDKIEFAKEMQRNLFYYFGCKCEWEVVITPFPPHIDKRELDRLNTEYKECEEKYGHQPYSTYVNPDVAEKVDVYSQVMLNFDVFIDYLWTYKKRI